MRISATGDPGRNTGPFGPANICAVNLGTAEVNLGIDGQ
jgi:hypothetical protein